MFFLICVLFLVQQVHEGATIGVFCQWRGQRKQSGETWTQGCIQRTCQKNGDVTEINKHGCLNNAGECMEIGSEWLNERRCIFYKCVLANGKSETQAKRGCKFNNKCIARNERVNPNKCSELKCNARGMLKAVKTGCEFGDVCKKNYEEWGSPYHKSCSTMKCIVRVGRSRFSAMVRKLAVTQHCKELFSDVCHHVRDIWYEFIPSEEMCKKVKCRRNGPLVYNHYPVCTHNQKCVMEGDNPQGVEECVCENGYMKCMGPIG